MGDLKIMANSTPRTIVNPQGVAQLYLRTQEIQHFFQAYLNYYEQLIQRNQRRFRTTLTIYLIVSALLLIGLFSEFTLFDDEEVVFFIIFAVVFLIGLGVMIGIFNSGKNKSQKQYGKGLMLKTFFLTIEHDLHPEAGLKGRLDHRKHQDKHRYKSKTSPHSGAKKHYYKYPWADLKFTLLDGSLVKLKCVDKIKEKSGSIVRFQAIKKGRIRPNELLYKTSGSHLNLRQDLCYSEEELRQGGISLGLKIAESFKRAYQHLEQRREQPAQAAKTPASPVPAQPAHNALDSLEHMLQSSSLKLQLQRLDQSLEIQFTPPDKSVAQVFWLEVETYQGQELVSLRRPIQGSLPSQAKLLRANPVLAYGRFALFRSPSGREQLCLLKTLLLESLDLAELETALQGLSNLANRLDALKALPEKTKAYRAERQPNWERMLLENALKALPVEMEAAEKKFKLRLSLEKNRYQTVHVRFDRQDLEGNQLISLLSYCGRHNPDLDQTALEENSHLSYGAIGLAHLGTEEMFVVSDNQLAATADPPELRSAILHIAQKADQLEAVLSGGADTY